MYTSKSYILLNNIISGDYDVTMSTKQSSCLSQMNALNMMQHLYVKQTFHDVFSIFLILFNLLKG